MHQINNRKGKKKKKKKGVEEERWEDTYVPKFWLFAVKKIRQRYNDVYDSALQNHTNTSPFTFSNDQFFFFLQEKKRRKRRITNHQRLQKPQAKCSCCSTLLHPAGPSQLNGVNSFSVNHFSG